MTDGREYRYQWDWNVPGGMAHVRCDDYQDFLTAKMNMEKLIASPTAFPDDRGPVATSVAKAREVTSDPSWCPVHKVTMKKYEKNGKSWYAHSEEFGVWCNGREK